jgi:TPR repeat protein
VADLCRARAACRKPPWRWATWRSASRLARQGGGEKALQSAITWYDAAAKAGVASAQFKLANAYFAGIGVARDPQQAARWYGRAAGQGLPEAQHIFGVLLTSGGAGTPDAVEGYKWLLLAERARHSRQQGAREKLAEKLSEPTASAPRRWRPSSRRWRNARSTTRRRGSARPTALAAATAVEPPPAADRHDPTSPSRCAAAPAG